MDLGNIGSSIALGVAFSESELKNCESCKSLKEELVEWLSIFVTNTADIRKTADGHEQIDTMARGDICQACDRLVDFGILEKKEGGFGRRQFYRYVNKTHGE